MLSQSADCISWSGYETLQLQNRWFHEASVDRIMASSAHPSLYLDELVALHAAGEAHADPTLGLATQLRVRERRALAARRPDSQRRRVEC